MLDNAAKMLGVAAAMTLLLAGSNAVAGEDLRAVCEADDEKSESKVFAVYKGPSVMTELLPLKRNGDWIGGTLLARDLSQTLLVHCPSRQTVVVPKQENDNKARLVLHELAASPKKYTMARIRDDVRDAGFKAKLSVVSREYCGCREDVLALAQAQFDAYVALRAAQAETSSDRANGAVDENEKD